MQIKKNIKPGKINHLIYFLILFLSFFFILNSNSKNNLEDYMLITQGHEYVITGENVVIKNSDD